MFRIKTKYFVLFSLLTSSSNLIYERLTKFGAHKFGNLCSDAAFINANASIYVFMLVVS